MMSGHASPVEHLDKVVTMWIGRVDSSIVDIRRGEPSKLGLIDLLLFNWEL